MGREIKGDQPKDLTVEKAEKFAEPALIRLLGWGLAGRPSVGNAWPDHPVGTTSFFPPRQDPYQAGLPTPSGPG